MIAQLDCRSVRQLEGNFKRAAHSTISHLRHFLTCNLACLSRIELPTTESELLTIATTPIIGCNRPIAAIGMAAAL
jgi:hypothetical protein